MQSQPFLEIVGTNIGPRLGGGGGGSNFNCLSRDQIVFIILVNVHSVL